MNIICSKQKLQDGISIVTKAITGKTTMPVLEGIYIQATKEGLTLIGSDMDVSIKTKVEAEVLKEGSIVIDSKIFSEIIRKLPNSDVKIEILFKDQTLIKTPIVRNGKKAVVGFKPEVFNEWINND